LAKISESGFLSSRRRSTSDLYRIVSRLAEKKVAFKVSGDPTIDTTSRTGRLVMGLLALIAEFENDIRRERQMDGIKKARERGTRFGRKPLLIPETVQQVRNLRKAGKTLPEIMHQMELAWSPGFFFGAIERIIVRVAAAPALTISSSTRKTVVYAPPSGHVAGAQQVRH
jgi:hypothetical protein